MLRKLSPHTPQRCSASSKPCWVFRWATSSGTRPKQAPQSTHRSTGSGLGFLFRSRLLGEESSGLGAAALTSVTEGSSGAASSRATATAVAAASASGSGVTFSSTLSLGTETSGGFSATVRLSAVEVCGLASESGSSLLADCRHTPALRCSCQRSRLLNSSSQSPH